MDLGKKLAEQYDASMVLALTDHVPTGFVLKLRNNWNVSVQWGFRNYCENQGNEIPSPTSIDAEISAWTTKEPVQYFNFDMDQVEGYCSVDRVIQFVNQIHGFAKAA